MKLTVTKRSIPSLLAVLTRRHHLSLWTDEPFRVFDQRAAILRIPATRLYSQSHGVACRTRSVRLAFPGTIVTNSGLLRVRL